MATKNLYNVYNGDELFLENVTRKDIALAFNCTITALTRYVERGYKLRGRYSIVLSQVVEEEPEDFDPLGNGTPMNSAWAREWDETCAYIRKRVEWVDEGGRQLKVKGSS